MHIEAKQDKFIELRAQGWTLGHIATELGVCKRTLVDWNREFTSDIKSLRAMKLGLLKEKIIASRDEELDRLMRLQNDIADELGNRTLKYIETEKLFRLSVELRQEIQRMVHQGEKESSAPAANGHLATRQ